jgi:hypothetical protein
MIANKELEKDIYSLGLILGHPFGPREVGGILDFLFVSRSQSFFSSLP